VKPFATALPPFSFKAIAGLALVCTLIGTILGGAGDGSMKRAVDLSKANYDNLQAMKASTLSQLITTFKLAGQTQAAAEASAAAAIALMPGFNFVTSSPELGAAFGCSIAATIAQAIALGLSFLPTPAAPTQKLTAPPAAAAAAAV
jgi:hypothetical protein